MKQISIVFSKRTNFNLFSWLIMKGLGSSFSHVAIKLVDGDTNQTVYYQASGLAINCISEVEFLSKETIIDNFDFQISEADFIAGKSFAINSLGEPYYMLAVLGFALQILLQMLNIRISNPFKENGSEYVCSQFAAAFVDIADNTNIGDLSNMTPLELYMKMPAIPKVWN